MADSTAFSLAVMTEMYENGTQYIKQFGNVKDNMQTDVNALGKFWTSEETGTYQEFKKIYDENKQILEEGISLMNEFMSKLQEKKNRFEQAGNNIMNAFTK